MSVFNCLLYLLIVIVEESGVSIAEERYKYERGNTCRAEASVNIEILGYKSYASLHYQFRVSVPSICRIVPEVCDVIYNTLKSEYLKFPESEEDWLKIATGFEEKWQLPHCVGAADGKHNRIIHPPKSGSEFYNYKGFFSIVLMAVVDADYNFIFADVGCQGRISDGGVMKNTIFWKKLVNNALHLPEP